MEKVGDLAPTVVDGGVFEKKTWPVLTLTLVWRVSRPQNRRFILKAQSIFVDSRNSRGRSSPQSPPASHDCGGGGGEACRYDV